MNLQLTQNTKEKIRFFLQDYLERELDDSCCSYCEQEYSSIEQLAVEELENNFEKVEFNYELLRDYYNDNYEVKNLEELKQLSCRYAKTLIN